MIKKPSHNFSKETIEEKAAWFQSLTLEQRMELFCEFTDLILENNPQIAKEKNVNSITGRVQILSKS